ncbi:hypothetical protein BJ165DRAFT_1403490 [Panaeolus papilionaceus]|nr:hypothetical protein BJ165DRAFT_1403490 [Panaeolus papilionaceus]
MNGPGSVRIVEPMRLSNINKEDIVILVYGTTGVGKSTFIKSATGGRATWVTIGDTLESQTCEIECTRFYISNHDRGIVLVDMPGFDDPKRSNAKVLDILSTWLVEFWERGNLISGIIYLYSLMDPRFSRGSMDALNILSKLCGLENSYYMTIVTTYWDEIVECSDVDAHSGALEREQMLKESTWAGLLRGSGQEDGAQYARFDRSNGGADEASLNIIWRLLDRVSGRSLGFRLLLQQELENGLSFQDTQVGKVVTWESTSFTGIVMQSARTTTQIATDAMTYYVPSVSFYFWGPQPPQELKPSDIGPSDYVIWVFGLLGSGRSTFITHLAGDNAPGIKISHGRWAGTHTIVCLRVYIPELARYVVLADTPCFRMAEISNVEVLSMLAGWLYRWCLQGVYLKGVILIQSIELPRLPPDVIPLICAIYGTAQYECVIHVTSMWSRVNDALGRTHEEELRNMWIRTEPRFANTLCTRWSYDPQDGLEKREMEAKRILIKLVNHIERDSRRAATGIVLQIQREIYERPRPSSSPPRRHFDLRCTKAGRIVEYVDGYDGRVYY